MQSPYLVENRHIAVKNCRHGLFMYSRNDAFVGRGLDLYGEWCDFEIQPMPPRVKPGDTVIDVGANIGTHTVAFANMGGPAGPCTPTSRSGAVPDAVRQCGAQCARARLLPSGGGRRFDGEIDLPQLPSPDMNFNFSAVSLMQNDKSGDTVPLVTLDLLKLSQVLEWSRSTSRAWNCWCSRAQSA